MLHKNQIKIQVNQLTLRLEKSPRYVNSLDVVNQTN